MVYKTIPMNIIIIYFKGLRFRDIAENLPGRDDFQAGNSSLLYKLSLYKIILTVLYYFV